MLQILILLSRSGVISVLDMPQGVLAYARQEINYTGEDDGVARDLLCESCKESLLIESSLDFAYYKANGAMVSAKIKAALLALEKSDGWRFD